MERVMRLPKKTMKPPSHLVIYGTSKDKVLLQLKLLKMENLVDLVIPCNMMICFNLKLMRTHMKLPKWNSKNMYPMSRCIRGLNYKVVLQLHEVLCIKRHLGV